MKRIIPCVFITLALILAGSFLPVFGFIGLMLCPLPLCILGCREGHKVMSIAELMIEATLFLAFSPSMAVYFLVSCAPLSAMIFTLSRKEFKDAKKYSGPESLLVCTGASIFFKVLLVVLFWFFTDRNLFIPNASQMEAAMTQLYGNQPEIIEAMNRILRLIPYLMPAMIIIYCSAESFMNYSLCSKFTRKLAPDSKNFPPELPEFKLWKFPASLIFASLFSLLLGYFIDSDTWFEGSVFVMNLQIIVNVFMFIGGLAILFWIMEGFKLKRTAKFIACVIAFIPFFWPWLIVMGMSDTVLNLRERIKFGK